MALVRHVLRNKYPKPKRIMDEKPDGAAFHVANWPSITKGKKERKEKKRKKDKRGNK